MFIALVKFLRSMNLQSAYAARKRNQLIRRCFDEPTCVIMVDGGFCSVLTKLAIGLSVKRESGVKVKYDLTWFDRNSKGCDGVSDRSFTLSSVFPRIEFEPASDDEIYWAKKINYFKDKTPFIFKDSLFKLGTCYLDGYYGNWRYLDSVADELYRILRFGELPLDLANREVRDEIQAAVEPIAIHIRRGDFVDTNNSFLSGKYYLAAIDLVIDRCSSSCPELFFFSDDPDFVSRQIIPHVQKSCRLRNVDINDQSKGYLDLYLISRCKHQIASNSSFGVWGGFLNQNVNKVVVIPDRWFPRSKTSSSLEGHETAFRFPGWTVLSVDTYEDVTLRSKLDVEGLPIASEI